MAALAADSPAVPPIKGHPGLILSSAVVNFSDLAREEALHPSKPQPKLRIERTPPRKRISPPGAVITMAPELPPASAASSTNPQRPLSPDLANGFRAELDNGTVIPPDTQGAVGPNHLMVTLNQDVVIQNRVGTILQTVSLTNFWRSAGVTDTTDPRVVFDPFNNRWITSASGNPAAAGSGVLVGVSANSDPTGQWFLYKAQVDSTNQHFCDFPILGFNKTWVVIMCNVFANDSTVNYFAGLVFVFSKANLYAHGSGAHEVLDTGGDSNVTPAITYDNSIAPEYLVEEFNGNNNGIGSMRLWQITGAVDSPVLSTIAYPSTSLTWDESGPYANFGPQLGGPPGVDTGDARIGNVIYRNGTLWTTHPVFLPCCAPSNPPTRASVQWWQIDTAGNTLQRGLLDNADASFFRSYPSIAVNKNNDALLGYARYSAVGYVGGYYSFRGHNDPPNQMENEATLITGFSNYCKDFGGGSVRWGDYSNTSVDPADDYTMWTIQEYSQPPIGLCGDNLWGTWWGEVIPPGPPASFQITANPPTATAGVPLSSFTVTVLDANSRRVTGYSGTIHFSSTDPTASLPADYTFLLSDDGTHSFAGSVTLDRAGSQSVTVTDTSNSALQATAPFIVMPGPLAVFAIQVPPSVTAGSAFTVTVTAQDAFQNTETGYNGTVQFSSSDATATLPANYTFTAADAGVHSFPFTLRRAGQQSIAAADVASFGAIQTSATVNVNAAAASTYVLAAPSTVTRTIPFILELTAYDSFHNQATSYGGTAHFTSSDALAALPANYTFVPADAGRHSFQATVNTIGTQSLTATDTITASISGSAQVTAAHHNGTARDLRVRVGQQFVNLRVADFGDDASPAVNSLTATINWGDGSSITAGTVSGGAGQYSVTGSHVYVAPPEHPVMVTVQGSPNGSITISSTVRMWPFTQSH